MESDRYELCILGAPDLRAPDGRRVTSVLSQPSRLALLSYLALAPAPVTRAAVVADFWPDSDEARARNALSQAVFYLRRSLGKDAVRNLEGDRLWVPPERVWCDARELLATDASNARYPTSVDIRDLLVAAQDDLLAGWNADGSQPLQEWLDQQRRSVRERVAEMKVAGVGGPPQVVRRDVLHPRPPARGWLIAAAAVALAALVLVAVAPRLSRISLATGSPTSAPPSVTAPVRLAVLLPRVTRSPSAPELAALTLNDELIARMPAREGIEVVSAVFASSLQDFTRQLTENIGPPDVQVGSYVPDWILDVSVVVTSDAVHVVSLLYRGTGLGVAGRDRFDHAFAKPQELVVDVPRAIADRIAAMVSAAVTPD